MELNILDCGALPEGTEPQTEKLQQAIDRVAETGGRVIIPAGLWRTGTLLLRSRVELHLARGAILFGTSQPDDYPDDDPVARGLVQSRRAFDRRLIYGCGIEDAAITGPGTIDGSGGCAGYPFPRGDEGRPLNLQFVASRRIRIEGVHLRCAGSWMMQILACEEVSLTNLVIWNHGNKTNDGLDIDGSEDVSIRGCSIDSHDDALVFKSTGPRPCRRIVVTDCRLRSNCHGIKFGTESVGGFEDIRISNCLIGPSRVTAPMEGFPEGRPPITGCALECVDGGIMRRISISGLIIEKAFAPLFIKLGNRHDRRLPKEEFTGQGIVEDVVLSDILATQAGSHTSSLTGYPGAPLRRITLRNINLHCAGGYDGQTISGPVPEYSDHYPEINMFTKGDSPLRHLPAYGLFFRHIEGLTLESVVLTTRSNDSRPAIVEENVTRLRAIP